MSSTSELYNKKCYCTKCSDNQQGYSFVSTQTFQCHNKRARYEDMERNVSVQRNLVDIDFETTSNQQTRPIEAIGSRTNSSVWEGAPISDNEIAFSNVVFQFLKAFFLYYIWLLECIYCLTSVGVTIMTSSHKSIWITTSNELNDESSDGDENDNDEESNGSEESEDDEENIVEIEVEEFDTEDPFATTNMPENPVHRFIATFVVMFVSHYVVNKGTVVLIEFIKKLLSIYKQDFQLPVSLSGLQSMTELSVMTKEIKRFVVCQDCYKVYEESVAAPLNCDFIKLGAHTTCNCKLMSYVYQSLKRALKILFLCLDFEQKIMHWNQEFKITAILCDVCDGEAWTDLKGNDNEIFVENFCSLMLTLNINCFQPFNGTSYSCGAIYLVINNLPRNGATVRAALLMVACDIPAVRKTSRFTAHTSTCACYKCNNQFSRLPGTSLVHLRGFDCQQWRHRSDRANRVHAEEWNSASTPSERQQLEVEYGVRWLQLYCLGYFDLVRGMIIDSMHNLFLGTPKRMIETWTKIKKMKNNDLLAMQTVAATMIFPSNYTKLKTKTGKDFSHMKADEWKSWVLVYSPMLLKLVLPSNMFNGWMHYVKACHILVKPSISFIEVDQAHSYLQEFCQSCEDIYEPKVLTCKMHRHLYLHDTIRDFGFVYGYWLFGFERYNDSFLSRAAPIKGNEPLPPSSFPLQSLKESTMSDIDYPQLLDYYKIAYVIPNLISYHDARLSQYFVNNRITKLKSIDLLGQTYIGNNSSGKHGSLVQAFFHMVCSSINIKVLKSFQFYLKKTPIVEYIEAPYFILWRV
ncbi:hypothetical protein PHYBLDRAFT_72980 [Phycomyces blakesleeanus NRRL 1555(-)]|uniref:C2H2-type zinc finger transcription factor n=1 Tax=Phycomyces blakesleeanus (strain ATCC 8743b / DSM 1359 / FGSC 10004 / NBRC 33097 / NRRL 1555) TaxID=763407 RepID=A0A167R9F0_PHYB8|nr:hypothetical protein PHYBLDRAFT_72980 [Phycomyces blakesleeanus NRRL 1555(-)]OAD81159.1 hypothetical protein PHYBLDRAFT_72980 [Phycomyces blakesleeanus NRRL 1555(-)]|eukprot:XP_018299199.1 hypothetical protein PHYBLDRAFT_72980 [Phycomyces blakesleeanus NRRL 1555(-)]